MNVQELLHKHEIHYIERGKDLIVKCLNPEHPDRNPSLRIDNVTGVYNCFSCGFKGNLFSYFGERVNQLDIRKEQLKRKINSKVAESVGLPFPENAIPYIGSHRDIKPSTYAHFEAFTSIDTKFVDRIVFPIYDLTGRIAGFTGRHTSGGSPKYIVDPPGAKLPLFPRVAPINGHILLVEGIYDMLNLWDKGLQNVICMFGLNTLTPERLQVLKMQGVSAVDIFADGDEAGQKAANKIKVMCEDEDLPTRNISLEGQDPGSLSESQISKLKAKLYK